MKVRHDVIARVAALCFGIGGLLRLMSGKVFVGAVCIFASGVLYALSRKEG